jgi:hypothetical protein
MTLAYAVRFHDRLTYACRPGPNHLPASMLKGAPLWEAVRLRWRWRASTRRRAIQARTVPPVWDGTRTAPWRR